MPGEYDAIGVPFETRGRRADEWIDALRTLWRDDQPGSRASSRPSAASSAGPQPHRPGGPPIIASGMSTAARRRAVERVRRLVRLLPGPRPHRRRRSTSSTRLADEVDRPAELGQLEITITPLPGPIDADTVRRYEDLGVDRLVLVQDFADMAGGPDAARRGKFLDEMAACAERLDIT